MTTKNERPPLVGGLAYQEEMLPGDGAMACPDMWAATGSVGVTWKGGNGHPKAGLTVKAKRWAGKPLPQMRQGPAGSGVGDLGHIVARPVELRHEVAEAVHGMVAAQDMELVIVA